MKTLTSLALISLVMMTAGCASKTERQFISGCKTGGIDGSTCSCIYDKLENKYGEDGLKENIYTLQQTESFQTDMINVSYQCMKE
jgi:predicted secreted Zn-dependent protease